MEPSTVSLTRGNNRAVTLVEQVRKDRTIAVAAEGDFHGADVGCYRVHAQMHLAPLASALRPMLARLPFAVAEEPDPGAVDSRLSGPPERRWGTCTARVPCLRHSVEKSRTGQSSPASFSRLATIPAV